MAIYHCSIKIISRSKGKSAVAAAAYRSGENLTNEYDGITHDYTRKGGVVHTMHPPSMQTAPFCGMQLRKLRKRKMRSLQGKLKLPCPKN